MNFARTFVAAAVFGGLIAASPVMAHPKLLYSQPAANAAVSKPTRITLAFSEKLVPQMSGLDVMMTGMPGMANHAPMKMSGFKTSVSPDGKTLVATFARPLPAGTYQAHWHVVSADTHRIEGQVAFTVK